MLARFPVQHQQQQQQIQAQQQQQYQQQQQATLQQQIQQQLQAQTQPVAQAIQSQNRSPTRAISQEQIPISRSGAVQRSKPERPQQPESRRSIEDYRQPSQEHIPQESSRSKSMAPQPSRQSNMRHYSLDDINATNNEPVRQDDNSLSSTEALWEKKRQDAQLLAKQHPMQPQYHQIQPIPQQTQKPEPSRRDSVNASQRNENRNSRDVQPEETPKPRPKR